MKCPQCGSEGFSPEMGCLVCGHLSASPVPMKEGTTEEEMPISELNRMLSAMGVAPLSEYQTDPQTEPEPDPKPDPETKPNPETEPDPETKPNPETEPEPLVKTDEEPMPMAAQAKRSSALRKRLKAIRHVSGFGKTLLLSLGNAGEWVRETIVRGGRAIWRPVRSLVGRVRPSRSLGQTFSGENPLVRGQERPQEPETAETPVATAAGEGSGKEKIRTMPARKRTGSLLFWGGVPLLALALAIGMIAGVLAWRKSLHAPEPIVPEETSQWRYVPWTPPPERQPEPFVIIGE